MIKSQASDARRAIPSVDKLLSDPSTQDLIALYGREQVRVQVRHNLVVLRELLLDHSMEEAVLAEELRRFPQRLRKGLEETLGRPTARVLNATGILLHTNLGRAPLPPEIAQGLAPKLDAYCDLEMDLVKGRRGERNRRAEKLLTALTGAEAALVVNNNAAALVLALATLAAGRQVIVSRGELVEIGGSFRVPEILAAAGAELVEVGATNRTRSADYETAVTDATALLLKVFPSNYRISGFVASVSPKELVEIGRRHHVPVLIDEGSGLLRHHSAPQLAKHPSLQDLMALGCDLACGSGDKLLGGPQAGLLVGKSELISRCRQHPLYRALRPDRTTLLTLEEILRRHLTGGAFPLEGLWPEPKAHRHRLERMAQRLGASRVPADAFLGGGAAPESPIPGEALALEGGASLLQRLRLGNPPVVGYLRQNRLTLDLRTVAPADDEALALAVSRALESHRGGD